MKLLDCTLRDGGYYTHWDFEDEVMDAYIRSFNALPVDYIELGYRNKSESEYMGRFGYCPLSVLRQIRSLSNKRLVVMLNEKDCCVEDLDFLLGPIRGIVDMVRLAVDPKNFDRALALAKAVKSLGFEVGFNLMYMSTWDAIEGLYSKMNQLDGVVDVFFMVDSYGSLIPQQVSAIVGEVRKHTDCTLGFHGHNNLQLALINALTALDKGVQFVDSTILGMGRGAGNLNTELLVTYLNKYAELKVDFNRLSDVLQVFAPLQLQYGWGTNLPYMLSGANSIPQKEVMSWAVNRKYSLNNIVSAIEYRRGNVTKRTPFAVFNPKERYEKVVVVGGGDSAVKHLEAIRCFLERSSSVAIVFATARFAREYFGLSCPKYYILVGSEAQRMEKNLSGNSFDDCCILPPGPHVMGVEVPSFAVDKTFELENVEFTDEFLDSCTTIAIATADLLSDKVYLVGYDGYYGQVLSEKEATLTVENRKIFESYQHHSGKQLVSFFPTLYGIKVQSVYHFLLEKERDEK